MDANRFVGGMGVVDPLTIRLSTAEPFPLMPTYMSTFAIISKKMVRAPQPVIITRVKP